MERSTVLAVGDSYHLRIGKDRIVYAGMPSENVYSIVQRKASGYQGFAWNLYFPRRKSDINIDGVNIIVENVSSEDIRFSIP
ncbi:MAG TPA: hypothetical protein G4O15_12980 [Dehalococcoidia bacterium]|nr:hypothetical protein [Dehalococcoidia bacterium]